MEKIIEAFGPIYKIFKFFGFLPFKISFRGVQRSLLSAIYSIIISTIFLHEVIYRALNTKKSKISGSPLSKITLTVGLILAASIFVMLAIFSYFNRFEFFKLIRIFSNFNRKVSRLNNN